MLVLLSFILAWGEAWFFDFRMVRKHPCITVRKLAFALGSLSNNTSQIPLETKAKEIWGAAPQRPNYSEEERTPLLAGGGEGGMLARYLLCLDYSKQSNNHKTSKDEAKTLIPFILMFVATFSVKE